MEYNKFFFLLNQQPSQPRTSYPRDKDCHYKKLADNKRIIFSFIMYVNIPGRVSFLLCYFAIFFIIWFCFKWYMYTIQKARISQTEFRSHFVAILCISWQRQITMVGILIPFLHHWLCCFHYKLIGIHDFIGWAWKQWQGQMFRMGSYHTYNTCN